MRSHRCQTSGAQLGDQRWWPCAGVDQRTTSGTPLGVLRRCAALDDRRWWTSAQPTTLNPTSNHARGTKEEVLGLTHQIKNRDGNDSRFMGLVKTLALNSLSILEKTDGGPRVKDIKQLIDCNKLTDVCSQFQNSNKQCNDSRKVKSLAIKSTYSKLWKDKGNRRVSSNRDGIEKLLRLEMPKVIGWLAVDPASFKFISKVCIARRNLDESEEGLDEVNEEGVRRDVFGSKVEEVGDVGSMHDRPIKRIGRKKNLLVKSHGMITRLSKATTLDLNQDFRKENLVPEEMKASCNLKEEIAKV
ncbi:hypothetical protein LWI29_015366 [Acer saccharum]|uniref:Uncharacterized protein n=1 Tax=Acer saccharum TaxID=4024 RepID=A0AA39SYD0_ACESA|nr:hypothetical protein LWI29_015366 [Acer saccharum]